MSSNSTDIITVIAGNLLEPLANLAGELSSIPLVPTNEVQVAPRENGYSCAIITLGVVVFESALNRTKYLRKDQTRADSVNYFKNITAKADVSEQLDEVVAVRDAIVHNHLWEQNAYWEQGTLKLRAGSPPILIAGFGDRRHRRVLDPKTNLSRKLGLNLVPLRICRADAYQALRIVVQALEALEELNPNYFVISNVRVKSGPNLRTMREIIDLLPNP
jgi:hypothetical protein